MPLPPVPGFAPASSLPRPSEEPPKQAPTTIPDAAGSNRNASNAHLPVPSAPPITLDSNGDAQIPSSTAASVGKDGQAAPKPGTNVNGAEGGAAAGQEKTSKPVNVPSGSKRSIVVNARQVGPISRRVSLS